MERLGFEVCGEVNTKQEGSRNLYSAHHTGNSVFKRVREVNIQIVDISKLLTPENNIDQLDINFQKDEDAIKAINLFYELKDNLKKPINAIIKFSLITVLDRLDVSKNSYMNKKCPSNSKLLITIFHSVKENLSQYGEKLTPSRKTGQIYNLVLRI